MKNQNTTNNGTAPTHAETLEGLFGGGPKLPNTHWMEKYAAASADTANARACFDALAQKYNVLLPALERIANGCTTDTGEHRLGTVNLDRDAMQAVARAAIARATAGGNGGAK